MLRFGSLIGLTLWASVAQGQTQSSPYNFSAIANLVVVPTQVKTKQGEFIYGLTANQFVVTDNGIPQHIRIDESEEGSGLSLVVLVECSGAATLEITKMKGLQTMVESIAGEGPHEIAIASYGAGPTLLSDFTSDSSKLKSAVSNIKPCGQIVPGATLDSVYYATRLLEARHSKYHRAILLIGETRDHGSHSTPQEVIAALGRTNTVVNSVAYSPSRDQLIHELQYGGDGRPNIIPWIMTAVNGMRKNASSELATLSGGEYTNFVTQKGLEQALSDVANHIHDHYELSFQPPAVPRYGFHALSVIVPDYPSAVIRYRTSYWSGTIQSPTDVP
jgi:VWFA-related protein